jgi:RHS repeat-associated protein
MIGFVRQLLAAILSLTIGFSTCAIASDPSGMNGAVNYTYDPVGNRTQKVSTLPGYPGGLSNYNANDELATDTYDANGNTTVSNGLGYLYDFENHPVQANGITYRCDGDGNRVSKTVAGVTTNYVVDTFNPTGYAQVVTETVSGTSPQSYVYGLERIAHFRQFYDFTANHWVYENVYYVYDGHGSVRALTDATGAVTDTYDYDAFGNLIHSTGSTVNNYLFAGEQFDPNLNLYYNRARYLNTSTGRFWSMDTYEGDPGAPESLHKYLYAATDPIDHIDPSGNLELTEALGALAIASVVLNLASLTYHLHQAFTANTPHEQAIATTLVYTDTLGLFLSLVEGGFVGPTSSLAASGGATIAVASVSETAIIGSIAIPGAANLIYFSSTSGGAGGGSGGGGSGGVGVKDEHVDVPKHYLNKLAPTYAEQKQLLIDAVEKITNAEKLGSNADGEAFEATVDLINSAGKPVTTTIRWFRYTDGTRTINTAFVPPATP